MLFNRLFTFLALYLVLLLLIALIGMKFAQKHQELNTAEASGTPRKKSALKGLYQHCPCRKAVENGTMSSLCIYSGIIGFMLSMTNIALMSNHETINFIILALSLPCAYLGWVLKK